MRLMRRILLVQARTPFGYPSDLSRNFHVLLTEHAAQNDGTSTGGGRTDRRIGVHPIRGGRPPSTRWPALGMSQVSWGGLAVATTAYIVRVIENCPRKAASWIVVTNRSQSSAAS